MTFSGTSDTSATNLQQPDTSNDGDNFAGEGTLGSFTVRNVRAIANSPTASSSCSGANQLYLLELAGAGVFRFQDGSLLEVNLTQGSDCIDLVTGLAHCTLTFQITGGTGRFKHASGVLTMTETVSAVLADALGNPVFFAATGEFTGRAQEWLQKRTAKRSGNRNTYSLARARPSRVLRGWNGLR